MKVPPVGLIPRFIVDERRLAEIDQAIHRYLLAGEAIPVEWIEERDDILSRRK